MIERNDRSRSPECAGELYVFCNSTDGITLAHGGNPKLVGKALSAIRDGDGAQPIITTNRIAETIGHGWHEYLWPNPQTRRIQRKVSYVLRVDDRTVCGSGYYLLNLP